MIRDRCPGCESLHSQQLRNFTFDFLHKCQQCGLVYDKRIPKPEELSALYSSYSYLTLKHVPKPTLESYQHLLQGFLPYRSSGRILDIGCGQGDFVHVAQESGWEATGIEYSEAAVALCKKRGLRVQDSGEVDDLENKASFDVVTAFEVIEHMLSPSDLFLRAYQLLRPGGLLYLTTPNFDALLRYLEGQNFAMVAYPEHLSFQTTKSLAVCASRSGFSAKKITTTGLDLARLRRAFRIFTQTSGSREKATVSDRLAVEALRDRISENTALKLAKGLTNSVLGVMQAGDTLKGWFVK